MHISSKEFSLDKTRSSTSLVTLSSAQMILCLSSSILTGRGGWQRPVPSGIAMKRNQTGTGRVSAAAILSENCLHLHHMRSIFLANSHWDKHVLSSSIRYKILYLFLYILWKFEVISMRIAKIIDLRTDMKFFGHPIYIYIYIYIYIMSFKKKQNSITLGL